MCRLRAMQRAGLTSGSNDGPALLREERMEDGDDQGHMRRLVMVPGGLVPDCIEHRKDAVLDTIWDGLGVMASNQGDWMRPMILPSASFTEAISLPPPTSLIASCT